jgi:pimeloyl-ACP methyl ester carboxylesterase
MNALKNAGFRILRYDQYGRGFSDRPDTVYSRDLFARQLKELLDSLDISDPVDLIGPSFGGAIAATFAAKYPERVKSIIFISPALNVINSNSPLAGPIKIMRKPVIGKFLYKTIIKRKIIERAGSIAPGGNGSPCHSNFTSQFTCKGTDRALLSMFNSDAFGDYREPTRITGRSINNILLIHGKADKEITGEMIEQIKEDLPNCQFVELQKSGHSPGTDATGILNGILVDYISKVQ